MGDIEDAIVSLTKARKALLAAATAAKTKSSAGAVHAADAAARAAKAHAIDAERAVEDAAKGNADTPHDPRAELKAARRLEELTARVLGALTGKKATEGDDTDERANADEKAARLELLAEEVHDVLARVQAESL